MMEARISFDLTTGDIIAKWPTHTDKIVCGIVYLTLSQARQAIPFGWEIYGIQTSSEEVLGLIKVKRESSYRRLGESIAGNEILEAWNLMTNEDPCKLCLGDGKCPNCHGTGMEKKLERER